MGEDTPLDNEVDEFILQEMDTVPHLEALLLLWNSRPKEWGLDEMAAALYVDRGTAREILQGLARRRLAERGEDEAYRYAGDEGERDALIGAVETAYKRNLVRISRMIHSKASPGVRDFADAFRFKKERD
jgi:hypothetical protein